MTEKLDVFSERLITEFRRMTGWQVVDGTRIHKDLIKFADEYSDKRRDITEVTVIFMIAHGIVTLREETP